ncbi:TRAP transporter small permease (plasmid) [Geminicoccaceae bacterium 1502E]|nr:TRAP transporter small permease [Geminicoccaceae bacterium 1502E]
MDHATRPAARGAHRALDVLRAFERIAVALILVAMSVAYAGNIIVREVFPLAAARFAWIEEATLFGLAWLVFLGQGLALERGRQIAMTALFDRLPAKLRWLVGTLINLAGVVFCAYLTKLGIVLAAFVLKSGQLSPTLDVSMAWLYGAVPVGFALLTLRYALELAGINDRYGRPARGHEH